ncbi:MAG: SAM-dependent methyltransferase [Clostridiales bacterium]|nr:SAM-dependent methyltransferase [Clostridiales bacterium]
MLNEILKTQFIKITLSSPLNGAEYEKISVRPVLLKGKNCYQAERFKENKVFHLNVEQNCFDKWAREVFPLYAQVCVFCEGKTVTFFTNSKGKVKRSESKNNLKGEINLNNNREKDYILKEGENIPPLVDLGVFTPEFKVVKSKYDKYKQINRFVELIDDECGKLDKNEITILDFGCGKSYLTFIVYYYFAKIKGKSVKIIGYDLKKDVVENCNKIARKYGYSNLEFIVADVKKDVLYDREIDIVISLHACDTATDYALYYAIQKGVKNIFSVPCCQHEVNLSIKKGGDMDCLLRYGIIKERVSALLTDSIRAMILEDMGYKVDVIEFVDLAHSPKNLMLRAKKTRGEKRVNAPEIERLQTAYGFTQTLFSLINEKDGL